jgi:hypothetical protein
MDIFARITGVKYTPFLCSKLKSFSYKDFDATLSEKTTFILQIDSTKQIALSCWVSPKRTRSYPYSRVYDTLSFSGKKATIIPILKDEGKQGDRDFLQWDTISLMSLLGVYVIISYYADASKSTRYTHKITGQKFNTGHIMAEIDRLMSYQSDALHWNMKQVEDIGEIGSQALNAYSAISEKLNVEMHSWESAKRRIDILREGQAEFKALSRDLARQAQARESITTQPKEQIAGIKGKLTIKNYLGGNYYLTCDEVEIHGEEIYLIEAKHTNKAELPSFGDIKDGLVKMILFTNLENLKIDERNYNPVPVLKLTTGEGFSLNSLGRSQKNRLTNLKREAETNGFQIITNDEFFA